MIQVTKTVDESSWRDFLSGTPGASIYHTPEWMKFLKETFRYVPYYLFALDESGMITGLFPLFLVSGKLTGKRLVSLPFSHQCGPIGNDDSIPVLLKEAKSLSNSLGETKILVNARIDSPGFSYNTLYSTFILDLVQDPNAIWKMLDRGSVRWAIKRAKKEGVSVRESRDPIDVREFYRLNCLTKRELGVPCHPKRFLDNLFNYLGNNIKLYIAEHEGSIIGGGIFLYYKAQVIYGYGAADPDSLHLHPYHAFLWEGIREACSQRYGSFDFGRTFHKDTGLIEFKRRWGTREIPLEYSSYPMEANTRNLRNGVLYNFGKGIFRHLPMGIYTKLSDRLFGEFG